jgi:hypothetical protein
MIFKQKIKIFKIKKIFKKEKKKPFPCTILLETPIAATLGHPWMC